MSLKFRPLMIQGTGSHVGKSFLVTALCRIFLNRGYEVAPFKAQNMALNSAAVIGGEIGRAQAIQAAAARVDPDVRMNPLLLKPCGQRKSQAVLMGKPVGTFGIRELDRKKPVWFRRVRSAFESLEGENDLVVLEGAGSPAEINLRKVDYANMRAANMAGAAVILVGDIDRGGVFAALYGTFSLLRPAERKRIVGFIINKFRGDPSLLASGLRFLERKTGKPVLGVVPYDTDLRLPEEDSLALSNSLSHGIAKIDRASGQKSMTLGLVRVPSIANFTDYDPFQVEPDVIVRNVFSPPDLRDLAAVILPGSKNVFADIKFLRDRGLDSAITCGIGIPVIGICGGFQILGMRLDDPLGIENGRPACASGLGLLPVRTEFRREKIVRPVEWKHRPSRSVVRGYEIHHGIVSALNGALNGAPSRPMFHNGRGATEGCLSADGRIWGTLTHGVFDSDEFRNAFLNDLRTRHRLPRRPVRPYDVEPSIERAARLVEKHVDVAAIFRILKKSA